MDESLLGSPGTASFLSSFAFHELPWPVNVFVSCELQFLVLVFQNIYGLYCLTETVYRQMPNPAFSALTSFTTVQCQT